ncbi:MAG TPA: DUF1223 domain-containing protein [Verrucomicrobiae bacterium]|nr:DUF1223 domain-containing protein [Verrucomicrobiae bacterium]
MPGFSVHARFLVFAGFLAVTTHAQTNLLTVQSGEKQTALLELYSSEGCSSCPPAEEWLSKLKESPGLWREFVPVAFHVDYWDYLGWRDRWGTKYFSNRQRDYAAHWRSDSVYTPGFVLNGSEWRDWSNHKTVPTAGGVKSGVLMASSSDTNHWRVTYAPAMAGETRYEAHAALLSGGLVSDVKAGENRGRKLSHDFVALNLVSAPMVRDGDSLAGEFAFGPHDDAANGRLAIAVWVTKKGHLEPLQAAGGWLNSAPR